MDSPACGRVEHMLAYVNNGLAYAAVRRPAPPALRVKRQTSGRTTGTDKVKHNAPAAGYAAGI